MLSATQYERIWIAILPQREANDMPRTAGTVEPIALVPGWVTDPRPGTREIPRRGGTREIQNAVEVISYHKLPDGRTFYKKQAQGLIGLHPRAVYVPDIDGPADTPGVRPSAEWMAELGRRLEESQTTLVAEPSDALIAAAEAEYGAREAVTA